MTVMMPKGTRTIPIPEPSITTSGNVVALKLVSFVVMVTVINVVLEVILSLALVPVERNGIVVVLADVEKKLVVVLAAVKAMFKCNRVHSAMYLCGGCDVPQSLVCLMVDVDVLPLVWGLLSHRWCCGRMIWRTKPKTKRKDSVGLVICLLVCEQDYTKTTERISTKLCGRIRWCGSESGDGSNIYIFVFLFFKIAG